VSILDNLPHTCTAKRRARTSDSYGGSRDTYTTVFSDRACWVQQAGDSEIEEFRKRGVNITNKIYFVVDPELTNEDVVEYDGDQYDVQSFPEKDASAGLGIVWRVMVNRVTEI